MANTIQSNDARQRDLACLDVTRPAWSDLMLPKRLIASVIVAAMVLAISGIVLSIMR